MRKTAEAARARGRLGLTLVETPANPTNGLVDLTACAAIADDLARAQGYISIGIENVEDLISDLAQGLEYV
jgi:cystathionine beta-lyase/cystathionine gamma-synthase